MIDTEKEFREAVQTCLAYEYESSQRIMTVQETKNVIALERELVECRFEFDGDDHVIERTKSLGSKE